MPKTTDKYPVINYTSRDFNSIKNDLVQYAKRYYPDTFKDFNKASFGALMLDTVSYVGDILSFYLDYEANESFLTNATQYENVIKLAKQIGYSYEPFAAASGLITCFIMCPANTNGIGPDTKYLPSLLRGSTVSTSGGPTFIFVDDVDFSDPDNEVVVASTDANNTPTFYAVKARGVVTSGQIVTEDVAIGNYEKFRNIKLETKGITEILSVEDYQGHRYYEVGNLSQNVIYVDIKNTSSDRHRAHSVMVPLMIPRRFTTEMIGATTFLQFGYGSEAELSSNPIADPADVVMKMHGRDYMFDEGFDPKKMTETDKLGVGPSNTVLTIVSRINNNMTVNASSETITSIVDSNFSFIDRALLNDETVLSVETSLEITNEEPLIGDATLPTVDEIKHRAKASFAMQNRAVTQEDYKALMYAMPAKFGKIKRCSIQQDPDSFRRNLNVYVISEAPNFSLIQTTSTIKENLKTWVGRYKMVNDTIDILDAKIVNIGIEFKVIAMAGSSGSKHSLLRECIEELRLGYFYRHFEIGEPLDISRIYKILNTVRGVMDTVDVKIVNQIGALYSDVALNINANLSSDGRILYPPEDIVFEMKEPDIDLMGVVE